MTMFNRILLAKVETTYGTSSTPAGSDAMRVGNDLDLKPLQLNRRERELLLPHLGNRSFLVAQRFSSISFSFEFVPSGTAGTAPGIAPILRAGGYGEAIVASTSVTYTPVDSSWSSATLSVHHNGKRHVLTGVRGSIEWSGKTNEPLVGKFDGMGIYNAPSDQSNPSLTYTGFPDPDIINSDNTTAVSVHGFSACMEEFSFNVNSPAKAFQRAGCTKQIRIDTERKPEGSITIEAPALATQNYFTAATSQSTAAISFQHGQTAGRIITFNAAGTSIGDPEYVDGDGVELIRLPFTPVRMGTTADHTWVLT